MKYVDLREAARRQHRALGLYAAISAWLNGWDGVAIERAALERVLGLQKFQPERVQWLREDLKPLFPEQRVLFYAKTKSLATLYVARIELDPWPPGTMSPKERVAKFMDGGRLGVLPLWPKANTARSRKSTEEDEDESEDDPALTPFIEGMRNHDERLLTAYLALLSSGQIDARQVPGILP